MPSWSRVETAVTAMYTIGLHLSLKKKYIVVIAERFIPKTFILPFILPFIFPKTQNAS